MDNDKSKRGLDVLGLRKEVLVCLNMSQYQIEQGQKNFNGGACHLQEDVWTTQPELEDISPALDSLEAWWRENM